MSGSVAAASIVRLEAALSRLGRGHEPPLHWKANVVAAILGRIDPPGAERAEVTGAGELPRGDVCGDVPWEPPELTTEGLALELPGDAPSNDAGGEPPGDVCGEPPAKLASAPPPLPDVDVSGATAGAVTAALDPSQQRAQVAGSAAARIAPVGPDGPDGQDGQVLQIGRVVRSARLGRIAPACGQLFRLRLHYRAVVEVAAALAVAAVVLLSIGQRIPRQDELALTLDGDRGGPVVRGLDVHAGSVVHAAVTGGARHRALWVYRNDHRLVAVCPAAAHRDSPVCLRLDGQILANMTLEAAGTYCFVAVASESALPVPGGNLDDDLAAAARAGAVAKRRRLDAE